MNIASYGEVLSILDHRKQEDTEKHSISVYELLVEWDN